MDARHYESVPLAPLPQWRCHKVVQAAPIKLVHRASGRVELDLGDGKTVVVICEPSMFARFTPGPGDFFVVYDDGYRSFSPRAAFIDGYARIDDRRMDVV